MGSYSCMVFMFMEWFSISWFKLCRFKLCCSSLTPDVTLNGSLLRNRPFCQPWDDTPTALGCPWLWTVRGWLWLYRKKQKGLFWWASFSFCLSFLTFWLEALLFLHDGWSLWLFCIQALLHLYLSMSTSHHMRTQHEKMAVTAWLFLSH